MSLSSCPDCGKPLSSFSSACIHCGYRPRLTNQSKSFLIIATILQIIAIMICVLSSNIFLHEIYADKYTEKFYYDDNWIQRSYLGTDEEYFCTVSYNILLSGDDAEKFEITPPSQIKTFSYITVGSMFTTLFCLFLLFFDHQKASFAWYAPLLSFASLTVLGIMFHKSKHVSVQISQYGYNPSAQAYPNIGPSFVFVIILLALICIISLSALKKNKPSTQSVTRSSIINNIISSSILHCPNCHAQISQSDNYCTNCGECISAPNINKHKHPLHQLETLISFKKTK